MSILDSLLENGLGENSSFEVQKLELLTIKEKMKESLERKKVLSKTVIDRGELICPGSESWAKRTISLGNIIEFIDKDRDGNDNYYLYRYNLPLPVFKKITETYKKLEVRTISEINEIYKEIVNSEIDNFLVSKTEASRRSYFAAMSSIQNLKLAYDINLLEIAHLEKMMEATEIDIEVIEKKKQFHENENKFKVDGDDKIKNEILSEQFKEVLRDIAEKLLVKRNENAAN